MVNENKQQKEELLGQISELFLTYGLRSTSMEDICNHLKISKKTLYQIFTNKDDVVEQVMRYRREMRLRETSVEELMKMNPVHILFNIKLHIINDLSSRLPANLFDMKKYHPEVEKKISAEDGLFITELLSKILSYGMRDGYFRKDLNMDVQIYLFSKQMSFLGEPETMNAILYPIPVIISTIVDNFIRTICSGKGIMEFERLKEEETKQQNKK